MRRFFVFFFLVPLVLTFSMDVERVLSLYKGMIEDYDSGAPEDEFVSFVKSELVNMSLYRFYKNKIVGSMEKREFALNISDFLHAIYESEKTDDEDLALARALFLAYVNAKLQGKNLTPSIIKRTSSFNSVYDEYGRKLRYEAYSILKHVFAYYLGAYDEKPPLEIPGLEVVNLGYSYKIRPRKYRYLEDVKRLLKDEKLMESVVSSVEELSKREYKDEAEFRRELSRKVNYVMRFFDRSVALNKEKIASMTAKVTPKESNIWWVRFLVYGVLISLSFRRPGVFKWLFTLVLILEAVYIVFLFDMNSPTEGLYYSLAIFFSFSFVLLLKLSNPRSDIVWTVLGISLVITMFIPAYTSVASLSMDENPGLKESPFYSFLKSDLYSSETSGFMLNLGKLVSNLSASREETRYTTQILADFVYKMKEKEALRSLEVTPNGIYIVFPKMSDYYSHRNFDGRISDFEKVEAILGDYVAQEKVRKRRTSKYLEDLLKRTERIVEFSADYLRRDFESYIRDYFEKKVVLRPVLEDVERVFSKWREIKSRSPNLFAFQTRSGIVMILLLMLGFTAYNLGLKNLLIPIVAIFGSLYPFFSRHLEVFVQYGVETLRVSGSYTYVPLVNLVGLAISFWMAYEILRRRGLRA